MRDWNAEIKAKRTEFEKYFQLAAAHASELNRLVLAQAAEIEARTNERKKRMREAARRLERTV